MSAQGCGTSVFEANGPELLTIVNPAAERKRRRRLRWSSRPFWPLPCYFKDVLFASTTRTNWNNSHRGWGERTAMRGGDYPVAVRKPVRETSWGKLRRKELPGQPCSAARKAPPKPDL